MSTQNTGAAIAPQEKKNDIRALLATDSMKKQIELALPKHMTPDRMVRVALTAINKTPKLLDCTRESLLAAIMTCSQFGLEPDGRHAHLIPYGNQCQLILDYKGLVALMRRSGDVADVHADYVGKNDEFDYCFGTGSQLKHKPNLKERGEPVAFYSYVRLKDGSESFEVLGVDEVNSLMNRSSGYQAYKKGISKSHPWVTDYNEMGKKTAFRRHSKWLPLSVELLDAMAKDDDQLPPVGENERFEKAKPTFGTVSDPAPQPQDPAPEAPAPAEEKKEEVQEKKKDEVQEPSPFDKLQILAEENCVDWMGILPAMKKVGQIPAKSSITSLRDVADEKLAWALANFDQMLPYLVAKGGK